MLTGPGVQCWWVGWACAIGGGGDCGKMGTESIVEKGQLGQLRLQALETGGPATADLLREARH